MSTKTMFKAALAAVLAIFSASWAQDKDTVYVPFRVNVDATAKAQLSGGGEEFDKAVRAGTGRRDTLLIIPGSGREPILVNPGKASSPVVIYNSRGKISLELPRQLYRDAEIALYSLNGKQIFRGKSHPNVVMGVYVLSVKGTKGNTFTTRLAHGGGGINIDVTYVGEGSSSVSLMKTISGVWRIVVSAEGYIDSSYTLSNLETGRGNTPVQNITLRQAPSSSSGSSSSLQSSSSHPLSSSSVPITPLQDYTDSATGTFKQTFKMIRVDGGTFTMGCEQSSGCPSGTTPTSQVTLHNYWIGETEVTNNLWNAVMGGSQSNSSGNNPKSSITWYDAQEFACKLGQKTGRMYRLPTEAEWEYAAKGGKNGIANRYIYSGSNTESQVAVTGNVTAVKSKSPNQLGIYDMSGNVDELAYNSWVPDPTSASSTNPIGPGGQIHTQKTRRGGHSGESATTRQVSARRIRSIDGKDGTFGLRIVYSEQLPSGMVAPCDIHAPQVSGEPENSYRDLRWVTGDDFEWRGGGSYTDGSIGESTFKLWADGTAYAKVGFTGSTVQGQWYTINNIALVIVPSSGSRYRWPYIFMNDAPGEELISVISDKGFNGFIGRLKKVAKTSTINKPSVTNPQSGAQLAAANSPPDVMVNMVNIPSSAQVKDSRLLDGTSNGWFQDNSSMQGTHHYRKDVDQDIFRFAVILPQLGMTNLLAIGSWFTVGNTFLRVTTSSGYITDYLYTITSDGEFHHVSFQEYERGDFRMFKKMANSEIFVRTSELPTSGNPVYSNSDGKSTFVPAPCPATGCQ